MMFGQGKKTVEAFGYGTQNAFGTVVDAMSLSFHRYVERGIYDLDWGADDNGRSLEME